MKSYLCILLITLFYGNIYSQILDTVSSDKISFPFQEDITISNILIDIYDGKASWVDFDTDGDLDIFITGKDMTNNGVTKLYRNQSGMFIEETIPILQLKYSDFSWGDFDNDGDPDLIIIGSDNFGNYHSKLYRNENGSFVDTNTNLLGIFKGGCNWGDYDNDGDLDLFLSGSQAGQSAKVTKIYNNNNGSFIDTNLDLNGIESKGSITLADFDKDLDNDLLICGLWYSKTKIFLNNQGNFTPFQPIVGVRWGAARWGDFNNDGLLDISESGWWWFGEGFRLISNIYSFDGVQYNQINTNLTALFNSDLVWGDFDSDGDRDLFICGTEGGLTRIAKLYDNINNTFIESITSINGVDFGSVSIGDYDNDSDLDLLISGLAQNGLSSKVYKNLTTNINSAPSIPLNLNAVVSNDTIEFTWGASTDFERSGPQKLDSSLGVFS